jgi:hypothetical protein
MVMEQCPAALLHGLRVHSAAQPREVRESLREHRGHDDDADVVGDHPVIVDVGFRQPRSVCALPQPMASQLVCDVRSDRDVAKAGLRFRFLQCRRSISILDSTLYANLVAFAFCSRINNRNELVSRRTIGSRYCRACLPVRDERASRNEPKRRATAAELRVCCVESAIRTVSILGAWGRCR